MNTRERHCIELMQRINTSSSNNGFQPGGGPLRIVNHF